MLLIMSISVLPLVNLPVGPNGKSIPYGLKLDFAEVGSSLLFPLSDKESPKMKRQGTWDTP